MNNNEGKAMGFFEKLVGVFSAPGKVMENIKEHPKMLWPLIYAMIIGTVSYFISMPLVQAQQENISRLVYERYGIDTSAQTAATSQLTLVSGLISTTLGVAIAWVFGGLVYWLISKIFKGKASLKQVLAVNAHVLLLTSTLGIISAALTYLLKLDVDIFSLAILMPTGDMTSFIYNLMTMITLYSLWGVIVTGIGLSVVNEFSRVKGYITSAIVYLITALWGATTLSMVFWMYDMTTRL